jgi:hypothetical protein
MKTSCMVQDRADAVADVQPQPNAPASCKCACRQGMNAQRRKYRVDPLRQKILLRYQLRSGKRRSACNPRHFLPTQQLKSDVLMCRRVDNMAMSSTPSDSSRAKL